MTQEINAILDSKDYLKTGFTRFDEFYVLRKGDLIGVAAYCDIGKEDFAIDLFLNISEKEKTLFVTSSQSLHSFNEKLILKIAEIDEIKAINGMLNGLEYQRYVATLKKLNELDYVVSRELKDCDKYRNIFIEDVHILSMKERGGSMHDKMSNLLIKLKEKAIEENIVIFVGLQLGRKTFERVGFRPSIIDIHECSNASNICDQIFAVHRRDYFDRLDHPGIAEIIPLKTKREPIDIKLEFNKESRTFKDYPPDLFNKERDKEAEAAFADWVV